MVWHLSLFSSQYLMNTALKFMHLFCALLIGNQCIAQKHSSLANAPGKTSGAKHPIDKKKLFLARKTTIPAKKIKVLPEKASAFFSQISDRTAAPFMLATALYTQHLKLWSPLSFVLTGLVVGAIVRYSIKTSKYRKKQRIKLY